MSRIIKLDSTAASPANLPTSARFRLVDPAGLRIDADHVTIASGRVNEFVDLVDGTLYGANSNMDIATVVAVNGVNIARFDPTSMATPTGYTMQNFGFANLNATPRFTFAALWKVTDAFVGSKVRETIAIAAQGTLTRAGLRADAGGSVSFRVSRDNADPTSIVTIPAPTLIDGWMAAAGYADLPNNRAWLFDLLGDQEFSTTINGTSGANLAGIDNYRLGHLATADRFGGDLADYIHLPGELTSHDLLALRLHMRARATNLAA